MTTEQNEKDAAPAEHSSLPNRAVSRVDRPVWRLEDQVGTVETEIRELQATITFFKRLACVAAALVVLFGGVSWLALPSVVRKHAKSVAETEAERLVKDSGLESIRNKAEERAAEIEKEVGTAETLVRKSADALDRLDQHIEQARSTLAALERKANEDWATTIAGDVDRLEAAVSDRAQRMDTALASSSLITEDYYDTARTSALRQWQSIDVLQDHATTLDSRLGMLEHKVVQLQTWVDDYVRSSSKPDFSFGGSAQCVSIAVVDGDGFLLAPAGFSESNIGRDLESWYGCDEDSAFRLLEGQLVWDSREDQFLESLDHQSRSRVIMRGVDSAD